MRYILDEDESVRYDELKNKFNKEVESQIKFVSKTIPFVGGMLIGTCLSLFLIFVIWLIA